MVTTQAVPIYENYDFYVPAIEVKVQGQSLEREVIRDVISVSYTDSLDKLDSCQITLNNWDSEKRDFKYNSAPTPFEPGTAIELYMGYLDVNTASGDTSGLPLMLRGQVVSLAPDFPAGGRPTIQVRALNELYKLHFKQGTQVFENKTDSQIAKEIVAKIVQDQNQSRSGSGSPPFDLSVDTGNLNPSNETEHEYIIVNNEYPLVFLMQRARANGYDMYIEETKEGNRSSSVLHFHPPAEGTPITYELVWGRSLVSFKPTLKTKQQVAKVTVRGWDTRKKEPIVGEATWSDLDIRGLPSADEMRAVDSALAGSEEIVADRPIRNKNEAKQLAIAHLRDLAKDLVTGSGSTVGLPELRAGRPVIVSGLGERFSGRYLITKTTHSFGDGGYTTKFDVRMEELS